MNDLLGRIAARAVGEAPTARPRPRALFEDEAGRADAELEVIDEEVPAVLTLSRGAAPTADVERAQAPSEARLAPPSALGGLGVANVARPVGALVEPSAQPPPAPPDPADVDVRPAVEGKRRAVTVASSPVETRTAAAVSAVAAVPLPPVPPPPSIDARTAALRTDEGSRDEPPAVRVHIGRLEVRANVPQQEPPPPWRERPSRDEGLSLSDYLRGKRVDR